MLTNDTSNQLIEKLKRTFRDALTTLFVNHQPDVLYDAIRYVVNIEGKYLRPLFTMLACGVANQKPKQALSMAISVELLHNFTLVHDDIMDQSEIRRTQPTVHTKWNEATAILCGDMLYTQALNYLDTYFKNDTKMGWQLYKLLINMLSSVCEGQAYDMMYANQSFENTTEKHYYTTIKYKTMAFIKGALLLGAYIGDANQDHIHIFKHIGTHCGLAFQIQDDLLDILQNTQTTGKPIGGDILMGKKTLLSIYLYQRLNSKQQQWYHALQQHKKLSEQDICQLRHFIYETGAVEKTTTKINHHYQIVFENIDKLPKNEYSKALKNYIKRLSTREK